jgi:hypothetical protein
MISRGSNNLRLSKGFAKWMVGNAAFIGRLLAV